VVKNNHAEDQVDAFLKILQERMDVDEEQIRRMVASSQSNGKTYITWAWVITVLLGLVSFLGIRMLDQIEKRIAAVEVKQADVRERLREVEGILRLHATPPSGQ